MMKIEKTVAVNIDSTSLDDAIEKANHLIEILQEAKQIIDSLSEREKLEA